MSQNSRLVEYFTSEFYFNSLINLAHIVSDTFTYSVNSGPDENFEKFAERRVYFSQNANLVIDDFTSDDDIHFDANFETTLINGITVSGMCMFKVSNGLIERAEIKYDLSDEEFLSLERALLHKN